MRKLLSYKVDFATARFIPNPANRVKHLIDLKGNFPTGLLPRVEAFLKSNRIEYKRINKAPKHLNHLPLPTLAGTHPTPYLEQLEAVQKALELGRGIITMPTGTGKSLVIALICAEGSCRTLIVVPTLELKTQLQETISKFFIDPINITIENIDSPKLQKIGDYDTLIIDEAHHVAAKTYQKLNKRCWNGISRRFFFTATPFRNNTEETLLFEGIAGQVIYSLSYPQAVKKGYIVPVEAYYYNVEKTAPEGYTYAQVYKELVSTKLPRNELIVSIITQLWSRDKFCLCLVKEIAHGNILSQMSGIPFANGADEDSRQWIKTFNEGRLKCLIGTTGILSEGVDTKPTEYVIVAGLGKAKSNLMQMIGRAVRRYEDKESAKIILFKDKSHKWTLKHFNEQCKIIREEYGTNPVCLE